MHLYDVKQQMLAKGVWVTDSGRHGRMIAGQ